MTDDAMSFPEEPEDFSISALRIVFFTGFAIVVTVLGFVFLPVAGVALALLIAWKGFDGQVWAHRNLALRALSMVALTGFAMVAVVMGFVFLPLAGAVLAGLFVWKGFGALGFVRRRSAGSHPRRAAAPTGNTAFDAYRAETLRRLEEEQESFLTFLARLRAARDQSEFDAFMADRHRTAPRKHDPAPRAAEPARAAPGAAPTDPWRLGQPVLLAQPDRWPGLAR